MSPHQAKRLKIIIGLTLVVGVVAALFFSAFRNNLLYFYTPHQFFEQTDKAILSQREIKLGGMVLKNSLNQQAENLQVSFTLTDFESEVVVQYKGLLPNLFREGQGVVATGKWVALDATKPKEGYFLAHSLLAKHDENYLPQSIAHLKKPSQLSEKEY